MWAHHSGTAGVGTPSDKHARGHITSDPPGSSVPHIFFLFFYVFADVDHDFWGRPEQQEAWLLARNSLPRKAYIWTKATAASDLMGMVRGRG